MSKEHWMGALPGLGRLRIDQLILPGSHDSGMDKQADNIVPPQEVTQDVSCIEQIRSGIRVLDLRVRASREYTPDSAYRYKLYHMSTSGRTVQGDVLRELNAFYEDPANAREIIILDFHQFDNFSAQEHQWLLQMLDTHIGQRIIPGALSHLTLEDLWDQHPGKTVVIAYNASARGHHWKGVEQDWAGENTLSTEALKAFMDDHAQRYKPDYTLRSIQCAKYNKVVFTPDDFSDKVDLWFDSQDQDSYIQGFHIINTDWSLRSRIVDNCIHACQVRAQGTP